MLYQNSEHFPKKTEKMKTMMEDRNDNVLEPMLTLGNTGELCWLCENEIQYIEWKEWILCGKSASIYPIVRQDMQMKNASVVTVELIYIILLFRMIL